MTVNYDHSQNLHTVSGPQAAMPLLFATGMPRSLLDVGCGTGTWLKTAQDFGVADIFGVDGVDVPAEKLLIPAKFFRRQDLTQPWDLGRKFEAAICLEVAEHLPENSALTLVQLLTSHADTIFFSAAAPGQDGQNHINCQWPDYWQKKFNECGFVCSDDVRWRIWRDDRVEPWYRQNLFCARRDPAQAGREERIAAVAHPANLEIMFNGTFRARIEASAPRGIYGKLRRYISGK